MASNSEADLQRFLASFSSSVKQEDEKEALSSVQPSRSLLLAAPKSIIRTEIVQAQQPSCTPITRMASEFSKASSGRLIAVNDSYICYVIKVMLYI